MMLVFIKHVPDCKITEHDGYSNFKGYLSERIYSEIFADGHHLFIKKMYNLRCLSFHDGYKFYHLYSYNGFYYVINFHEGFA